jgi:hypothetical protein
VQFEHLNFVHLVVGKDHRPAPQALVKPEES